MEIQPEPSEKKARDYSRTSLYVRAAPSIRLRDRKVSRLVRRMFLVMPWLQEQDTPLCRSWAQFEVVGDQVYAALRAQGVLNSAGEARRLVDDFRKLRLAQANIAAALGMSPASRSALRLNSGGDALDLNSMLPAEISDSEAADVIAAGRRHGFAAQGDDSGESRIDVPVSSKNPAEGDSGGSVDVDVDEDADDGSGRSS